MGGTDMSAYFGEDIKKLGFGLMRLPKRGLGCDIEQFKKMTDMFLEAGFTYFDTAYVYLGSEAAAKKALVDRHPRDSYTLCSKLNAFMAPTEKAAKEQFYTSLKRTGAEYFDFYLLHAIMETNYSRYDKFGIWDFVAEQKKKGLVKHYGFSFHAGPELLDTLLTQHPEVDFIQLQLNYADWENRFITSRQNYEVARKHKKPIVVMEPVKGGTLANPPKEVKKLFEGYAPEASYASWAIRFAASLEGIITVLSGMSNIAQMQDNISYMKDFKPLNDDEQKLIRQAQVILGKSAAIPCTACHYCTAGCPKKIAIPEIFSAMNKRISNGRLEDASAGYLEAVKNGSRACDCVQCRQCEKACPQHIRIADTLKSCSEIFDK